MRPSFWRWGAGRIISKTGHIGEKPRHEMLENRDRRGRWLITKRSAPTSAIARPTETVSTAVDTLEDGWRDVSLAPSVTCHTPRPWGPRKIPIEIESP